MAFNVLKNLSTQRFNFEYLLFSLQKGKLGKEILSNVDRTDEF